MTAARDAEGRDAATDLTGTQKERTLLLIL